MEENIQSTLQENRLFAPSAEFSSKARIKNRAELDTLRAKADADHEGFWAELARTELDWQTPFTSVLDEVTRLITSGSMMARLMCRTIAWIVIWPSVATKPPSYLKGKKVTPGTLATLSYIVMSASSPMA